ncbi:hypothetical protein CDL15_Pgr015672 [Punica granatum]|uniref:Uncharacterized protein n=1 Tax=Punica granatum TaxID=22663 RepID=A0A218XNS3_PUNGR|nr:hypothetical protein CDL15_Pgr015672 [Punica granatum]
MPCPDRFYYTYKAYNDPGPGLTPMESSLGPCTSLRTRISPLSCPDKTHGFNAQKAKTLLVEELNLMTFEVAQKAYAVLRQWHFAMPILPPDGNRAFSLPGAGGQARGQIDLPFPLPDHAHQA